jgi:ADP-heptose:LPS heptosyltransferase
MRKLILRCGLAPGDIVMLTAAVRDLHHWYPKAFATDVRTFYPEIWENNPYLTPLSEEDSEVEQVECSYPLINDCNHLPYHCLHGFIDFLNKRLRLGLRLTAFKGDIHLSELEKSWYSQVHELTGQDTPFWLVDAGGKYDVTIKWWEHGRYQEVLDHFRGRVQFVQVGAIGHHHPKLQGAIDLRGKTNFRELIRLVYHSQGILCPVTAVMHLAAAVESKHRRQRTRPCVVVAGGREPVHWESYPGHQFIHTIGALHCCQHGGCWKDRAVPLRDGDKRDRPGCRCVNLAGTLPRCMDLISPAEVIRRIQAYFEGGILRTLGRRQQSAAERGVTASRTNDFDAQTLNLHNAGTACDHFIQTIAEYPSGHFKSRGIVICGGGIRYFTAAWVCVRMLRHLGCRLPIELWHLGEKEMDARMRNLVAPFGVACVDAVKTNRRYQARCIQGWALKPYAILHSKFQEVLFLDADNVPVRNPEFLFDCPQFRQTGAILWPDYMRCANKKAFAIWRSCGLLPPGEQEFETGQMVLNKERCWKALCLSAWFNEHCHFYYRYIYGDKETFHLAFRKLRTRYSLVTTPIHTIERTMCQHDFDGQRLFQHRNRDKWDYLLCNRRIEDFWYEDKCRDYVLELRNLWDGGLGRIQNGHARYQPYARKAPSVAAVMISCRERDALRKRTLSNLAQTDWSDLPLHIQIDRGEGNDRQKRQTACALQALLSAAGKADYVLFLEDDLEFNRHLRHNLHRWRPFRDRAVSLASLYNPGLCELACDRDKRARIVAPNSIFGSQALLIANKTLSHILAHWRSVTGMQDIKISRLAGRLGAPILYHAPSLVQHVGKVSTLAGPFHEARDFELEWKAP